jgi:uncharacterized protein
MAVAKDFSVEERLISLIKVQKLESKVDDINRLRGELPMEVKDLEDEIEGLSTRANSISSEIASLNQFIETKLAEQKHAAELLKKYEKQEGDVKNSREFEAVNREIEMQELEIKAAERHIKDAKADIQGLEVKLEAANEKVSIKQEMLDNKKSELKVIIEDTEKEEASIQVKVDEAKSQVEARLLSAYERLRKSSKNGLSVVSVDRNSCGGCFNSIPPQRQAEIRLRKKIIACEHCGRVLTDSELFHSITI